jgi:hypothetical protein
MNGRAVKRRQSRLCLVHVLLLAVLAGAVVPAICQTPLPILPDPKLTPGDVLNVTREDICTPGYTKRVRDVPAAVKRQVYAEYGITSYKRGEFEVDHLISLELGGSNSIRNLWPESYKTKPWNAHVKDAVENELHRRVCSGELDLKTAQREIATDWVAAYKKYFHTEVPLTARRSRRGTGAVSAPGAVNPPGGTAGQVWVNTRSGKYFYPWARYYGRTKEGQYLSEAEARRRGYVPAR